MKIVIISLLIYINLSFGFISLKFCGDSSLNPVIFSEGNKSRAISEEKSSRVREKIVEVQEINPKPRLLLYCPRVHRADQQEKGRLWRKVNSYVTFILLLDSLLSSSYKSWQSKLNLRRKYGSY